MFRHCFLAIPYLYQTCYLLHYLCGFCWMCCFIITVQISEENDQWVQWAEHRNVYSCDMWIALRVLWSFCLQDRLELEVNLIKPTKAHKAINRLELEVNLIKPTKAHKAINRLELTHQTLIVQELCESRGGRPGLSILTSLLVSVDVKIYWTMLWHWSQLVPNMSTDIWWH